MFALLITWVALGDVHTMSVERVPVNECKAMAAEALERSTVRAVLCTLDGLKANDAVNVGECVEPSEMSRANMRVYYCNGSIPTWN
jgi:hypothetical protein